MFPRLSRPCTRSMLLIGAFVLLAVTLGATQPYGAAAQQSEPAPIIGSWILSFPNDGPDSQQLVSFLPSGVMLATNAPAFAEETVAGDTIYSTGGHGAWSPQGGGRYGFALMFLYFDAAENNWGALRLEGAVDLDASGDRLTGSFHATVTDTAGRVLFESGEQPLAGDRIRPPGGSGTPAAPAS